MEEEKRKSPRRSLRIHSDVVSSKQNKGEQNKEEQNKKQNKGKIRVEEVNNVKK
ncbi:hypothetical protein RDI58_010388 [Solanum bulbocastanum]|uniref:Uncharacterized protein n=1 Tax=Solanum bulbocastanum TaxID=147425 RepID=A0AAN8YGB7_SOLBU